MSQRLARIAASITAHWKRSLGIAIAAIILLGVAAGTASPPPDDFEVPGADSTTALDLFQKHDPGFGGGTAQIVYTVQDGKITDAGPRKAIEDALAKVSELEGVDQVSDPFGPQGLATQGRYADKLAAAQVQYVTEFQDIEKEDGEALIEAGEPAAASGVDVEMRGAPIQVAAEQEFPVGELVGVGLALILLTLLFRSKAAMGATLLGAILGLAIGQALISALSEPLKLPSFASIIAVMLGLGAGIDYALLILSRYREEVAAGKAPPQAMATAASTAGISVIAAGLIVMVAIGGLLVVGVPAIGKMGLGAAIGVFAVVISALFILPIMVGAFAKWLKPREASHTEPSPAFRRWAERVTKRPWLTVVGGVAILLVFAAPALDMRIGQPDDGNEPTSKTQRVAYDQLSEAFGPGASGPLLLLVDNADESDEQEINGIAEAIKGEPGVVNVSPAAPSPDGQIATISVTPSTSPQDARTSDLLERLREDVIPAATDGTPLRVYVGGETAGFEDFSDRVASRLPLFVGVVIGLSVLLLMAAFRSVWIPLISALFNLLSIGAAYGAVTAVFQKNIGAELIGATSGVPIVSFVPVLLFAILFGLSMDYNVFLLSRMQEAYRRGAPAREAVIVGFSQIGKVVLFAGLIMGAVFLAFMTTSDIFSKLFGVGLGLAILLDVLIIRLVVTPAVVTLLGDHAWWFPKWLDRLLPEVHLEGAAEEEQQVAAPA